MQTKAGFAFAALLFTGAAHAVSMSFSDGCGNAMSASSVNLTAVPSGDLTLNSTGTSTPYSVLSCDTNTAAPKCTLAASKTAITPGSSVTLVGKCTINATSYEWVTPPGWTPTLSGLTNNITFNAPGAYSFAVKANYTGGAAAWSNPITILVANATDAPVCTLVASPAQIVAGQSVQLHSTCNPPATSFVWTVDNGSSKPTSAQGSAPVSLAASGIYTFDVKGQIGTNVGPMASATVTVASASMTNWAAAANGGVASASSVFDTGVNALKNGERAGNAFGAGGVWSSKIASLPDGFYVGLTNTYPVDRVVLYSMQDDYEHPVEPSDTMTFQNYGARDFEIYHYNNGWQLITAVSGNNLVKKTVTFPPVNANTIMVKMLTMGTVGVPVARAVEFEVYAGASANLVPAGYITPNSGAAANNDQSPPALNNGEVKGLGFGAGGVWTDNSNAYPDWARIDFSAARTISRIVVYGLQDNYTAPVDPTDSLTCATYCVENFEVQTWNGTTWVMQGTATANNLVKKTFNFAPVTTTAIRVYITKASTAGGDRSRLVEIEAWGN